MDELDDVRSHARTAWSAGDFSRFAEMLRAPGGDLVRRLGIGPGDVALDVGCGTGNLAIQAAQAGASVTGVDIAPPMIERARRAAEEAGVTAAFAEGDAEALPAADGSFDVVMSSFACMFAPRHRVAASEMARVLRPGGRLGVLTWVPYGDVAGLLRLRSTHLPAPPPAAESPILWGDPDHVRACFAGTGVALEFALGRVDFPYATAREAADVHLSQSGHLLTARAALEPRGLWQPVERELREFFAEREEDGTLRYGSDYLIVLGRREG